MKKYLIWSEEHGAWWLPAKMGYTRSIKLAGHYGLETANQIVREANSYLPENEFHEVILAEPEGQYFYGR